MLPWLTWARSSDADIRMPRSRGGWIVASCQMVSRPPGGPGGGVDVRGTSKSPWRAAVCARALCALLLGVSSLVAGAGLGVASILLGPAGRASAATPGTVLFSEDFRGSQVSSATQNLLTTNGTFTPCLTASTNTNELPIPGCPTSQPGGSTGTLPDAPGTGALRLTSNGGYSNGYILY